MWPPLWGICQLWIFRTKTWLILELFGDRTPFVFGLVVIFHRNCAEKILFLFSLTQVSAWTSRMGSKNWPNVLAFWQYHYIWSNQISCQTIWTQRTPLPKLKKLGEPLWGHLVRNSKPLGTNECIFPISDTFFLKMDCPNAAIWGKNWMKTNSFSKKSTNLPSAVNTSHIPVSITNLFCKMLWLPQIVWQHGLWKILA